MNQRYRIQKCDLCIDRLAEDNKPICFSGCPMRALGAGPMDELKRKYNSVRDAENFTYIEDLWPLDHIQAEKGRQRAFCPAD